MQFFCSIYLYFIFTFGGLIRTKGNSFGIAKGNIVMDVGIKFGLYVMQV